VEEALLLSNSQLYTVQFNTTNDNNNEGEGGDEDGVSVSLRRKRNRRLLEDGTGVTDGDFLAPRIDAVFTFEDLLTDHRYRIHGGGTCISPLLHAVNSLHLFPSFL
jgi:hypothetical protein